MSTLPPPDPALGSQAHEQAAQAREDVRKALSTGGLTLEGLFDMCDSEDEAEHRVIGHMHLRGALLALPKIGEVKADQILEELGWSSDRHIDTLGMNQRKQLMEAVEARS